jgi:hypothetical protein
LLKLSAMKSLIRSLSLWALLAAIAWLMMLPTSASAATVFEGFAVLILPALAVWFTGRTAAGLPANRFFRWSFWALTCAGWLAVILLAAGRYERRGDADERQILQVAVIGAVLFPAWIAVRRRECPTWRVARDAAMGLLMLALAVGATVWIYDAGTRSIAQRAEARWTEIGLPMDEFEKSLAPVAESRGSEVVRQVLREQVAQRFYKEGTAAASQEPVVPRSQAAWDLVSRACEILSAKLPAADELDLSKLPVAAIEPHGAELDAAYRRILAAEPAQWACNPADGPTISVPNFLALRMFAQLTTAESMRRLAAGDEEGAARAIAAGLRVRERLDQNPALVSLMIGVALDALYAPKQARLAATGDGLEAVAHDAATMPAALVRTLRWEAWMCLRQPGKIDGDDYRALDEVRCLPKWARRLAESPFMRRHCAVAALNGAEYAAIRKDPATLKLPDLGEQLAETVSRKNPSICEVNVTRAAIRLYATLLLREQAELLRDARARLAAGKPVESRDSVVLPGVRWELSADAAKRTVSTRLTNAPKWVLQNSVTPAEFWVLPLDGSVAWQFRGPAKGVAVSR